MTCAVDFDNNCEYCFLQNCELDNSHPEMRCQYGDAYVGWEPNGDQSDSQVANCEEQSEQYKDQYGGLDNCTLPPYVMNADEIPNGIDDNCDGDYVDDEYCNGVDDDGNGLIDDSEGSCSLRFLFVPFCWQGNQFQFDEAVELQKAFFLNKNRLYACTKNYYFEKGLISQINLSCPLGSTVSHSTLRNEIEDVYETTGLAKYDLRNYDVFVGLTDTDQQGEAKGAASAMGSPQIWAEAQYENSVMILTHEFGHSIGLHDEYCSVEAGASSVRGCNRASSINRMTGDLGCDPLSEDCCSVDFQNPDLYDWLDDTPCGGQSHVCCKGNLALPEIYYDGAPDTNEYGGRCIMSNMDADGWTTDSRGWCKLCWEHWQDDGFPCDRMFLVQCTSKYFA